MLPSYLEKLNITDLKDRSERLHQLQRQCRLCPNDCGAKRTSGATGLCHSTDQVEVSSYSPHFGEEAPLTGFMGSGTIFFTNCNLKCVYCQNFDISQLKVGTKTGIKSLAEIMLKLQSRGCHNINLVTPTHFIPQIVDALILAVEKGLEIPIVYNCGGYESVETLILLENIIDIYMPDIKYSCNKIAEELSGIKGYWEAAKAALLEMHRQTGDLHLNRRGIAQSGLLVRHLVLPDDIAGSFKVLDFIASEISKETYINIMDQYHPAYKAKEFHSLNRYLHAQEFTAVIDHAMKLGLTRGL